jgi:VanZ family protein
LARWLRTLPFLALVALAGWLMLTPRPPELELPEWLSWDKLAHAVCWAALGLAAWMVPWPGGGSRARRAAWTLLITVTYGGLLELAQHFLVRGRTGELGDAVADALGAGLAVSIAWTVEARYDKRRTADAPRSPSGDGVELQGLDPGSCPSDALQQPGP